MTYPHQAGYKEGTTSKDAATRIEQSGRATTLRERVQGLFEHGWRVTAEEAAKLVGSPPVSVKPRLSELHKAGIIEHDEQVPGPYGTNVWRWKLAEPDDRQPSLFPNRQWCANCNVYPAQDFTNLCQACEHSQQLYGE